jgi:hypothetical protein
VLTLYIVGGITVVLIGGVIGFVARMPAGPSRIAKQIAALPLARIAELGTGRVRLVGVVRAEGDDATLIAGTYSARLGVYSDSQIDVARGNPGRTPTTLAPTIRHARFVLDDGSGTILVDPGGCQTDAPKLPVRLRETGGPFGASIIARNAGPSFGAAEVTYWESLIRCGDRIAVVGSLREHEGHRVLAGESAAPLLISVDRSVAS